MAKKLVYYCYNSQIMLRPTPALNFQYVFSESWAPITVRLLKKKQLEEFIKARLCFVSRSRKSQEIDTAQKRFGHTYIRNP